MKKLDGFITLMIFLVLVQTLLEELAVLLGWSLTVKNSLVAGGVVFDLFFTIEFLVRFFSALSERKGGDYFFRNRGWVDCFASLPLLLLDSGPRFYALMAGSGMLFGGVGVLNILKAVKAIRLARILRFLRALKLFRNIKHAESRMAQRHLARISTLAVTAVVFASLFYGVLVSLLGLPSPLTIAEAEQNFAMTRILESGASPEDSIRLLSASREDLLLVRDQGGARFSRFDNTYYAKWFSPEDYRVSRQGELHFFFDMRIPRAAEARERLLIFVMVIVLLLLLLFVYGPHFAVTVTDPIHVMRRGFSESEYSLEVKIDPLYEEDDLFQLARRYNDEYLPLKVQKRMEGGGESSALSMDALGDLTAFTDDLAADQGDGGDDPWS